MFFNQRSSTLVLVLALAASISFAEHTANTSAATHSHKPMTSSYQKPGAPVRLHEHTLQLSDTTPQSSELLLHFEANGIAEIALSSTPENAVFSNTYTTVTVTNAPEIIRVPINTTIPLKNFNYINVFVTFIGDNGRESSRVLAAKLVDPNKTKLSEKLSSTTSSSDPIYMPAAETITYQ